MFCFCANHCWKNSGNGIPVQQTCAGFVNVLFFSLFTNAPTIVEPIKFTISFAFAVQKEGGLYTSLFIGWWAAEPAIAANPWNELNDGESETASNRDRECKESPQSPLSSHLFHPENLTYYRQFAYLATCLRVSNDARDASREAPVSRYILYDASIFFDMPAQLGFCCLLFFFWSICFDGITIDGEWRQCLRHRWSEAQNMWSKLCSGFEHDFLKLILFFFFNFPIFYWKKNPVFSLFSDMLKSFSLTPINSSKIWIFTLVACLTWDTNLHFCKRKKKENISNKFLFFFSLVRANKFLSIPLLVLIFGQIGLSCLWLPVCFSNAFLNDFFFL